MEISGGGSRDEVERLAEEFVERRRQGERPTIEEYAEAHPALAEGIRSLFKTLLLVEEFGEESESITQAEAREEPRAPPELKQLGEYRILREIGRGGMGIVYEAEQASLGRRVALKVLPFHFLLDAKRLERFLQEARAAARLSHPNIVPVFGVGEHLGLHYYVMQLIPGQGLNRVIEELRRQRQSGESSGTPTSHSTSSLARGLESTGMVSSRGRYFHNAAALARDAALALDYAHAQGILHRDVKPSNLLLDPSGRVWLTDFGLAKSEGSDDLTHSGDFVGTALYMAPERFKGWSDPRSDVYALGITLYELLTLRPTFYGRERAEILRKVTHEEPPTPRRVDRSIPRDLETIVLKAIDREPSLRYKNARSMAQDLDRFLTGQSVEARRLSTLDRWWRWCVRNRLLAAGSAIILLLLVAVAVVSSVMAARLSGEQTALLKEQAAGREKLRTAYLSEAGALRASARPGRRFEALAALSKAAAIRPGPDLVDEALASLALVDLRPVKFWSKQKTEAVAFTPDGSTIATALPSGEIVLRDANSGEERTRFPSPNPLADYVFLRFDLQGKLLASRHEQGSRVDWRIWEVGSHRLCAEVKDGTSNNWMDFDPQGRWVVLGTQAKTLRILELSGGTTVQEIGQGMLPNGVAVHPGARLIAFSSGATRGVHIHDRHSGQMFRNLSGSSNLLFEQVAWHPDGQTVAAANRDHKIYLWNAQTGELTRILRGHFAEVMEIGFSPGGEVLSSAGWEPAVRFWDPASEVSLFSIASQKAYFNRDRGSCWTVGANRDRVEWWELKERLPAFTILGHEGGLGDKGEVSKHPHSVALMQDGRLAATAGDDGVRLWDLTSRAEVGYLGNFPVSSVCFDASGAALYASGWAGLSRWPIRRLDAQGERLVFGPPQHVRSSYAWGDIGLEKNARLVAAVHKKEHVHVFDPARSAGGMVLNGPPAEWIMDLSSDGSWAAAGSSQSPEVWLWDLTGTDLTGPARPATKLRAPGAFVKFHPAGTHLVTSTAEEITLWNHREARAVWRIEREPGLRNRGVAAFNEDGSVLAATFNDSRIWLLETSSGKRLSTFEAPDRTRVNNLAQAGGRLVACTPARRFHVWDLNGLAREVDRLGLDWQVRPSGPALAELTPRHVTVVQELRDSLEEERLSLAPRQLFRPHQSVAFMTELSSFTDIDRALETPTLLIAEGQPWKYFRGTAEPSDAFDWTQLDFDDNHWETGKSPITAWGHLASLEGTILDDQIGKYTTVYLRRVFSVSDPGVFSRLTLAVQVEDGLVAFLNGHEVGRVNAGEPAELLSFGARARQTYRGRATEVFEIEPRLLKQRKNVLALQVLSYSPESKVHALPVLAAELASSIEQDGRRTENLVSGSDGAVNECLSAYRSGRILQRAGKAAEAIQHFERASQLDPGSAEPLLRQVECHVSLGEPARAATIAQKGIERGEVAESGLVWQAWSRAMLVDLRRTPEECIASFPRDPRRGDLEGEDVAANYRWLLEEVSAHRALRMRCGANEPAEEDGKRWSRDRFFLGGVAIRGGADPEPGEARAPTPDARAHAAARSFPGVRGRFRHAYKIPLPPGRYRAALHFLETTYHAARRRVFDVYLGGKLVAEGYDPFAAGGNRGDVRTFELEVTDGALRIDFVGQLESPEIAALEVEVLGQ